VVGGRVDGATSVRGLAMMVVLQGVDLISDI
jgi:hypothetical protein